MLSMYNPIGDISDIAIMNSNEEITTSTSATDGLPHKDCIDLMLVCVPPYVFGTLVLALAVYILIKFLGKTLKVI